MSNQKKQRPLTRRKPTTRGIKRTQMAGKKTMIAVLQAKWKELQAQSAHERSALARTLKIETHNLTRQGQLQAILSSYARNRSFYTEGVLDIQEDGNGQLRATMNNYLPDPNDVIVSAKQIAKYELKTGDTISGIASISLQKPFASLTLLHRLNLKPWAQARGRIDFDDLTAVRPKEKISLEGHVRTPIGPRIIDLFFPLTKGQRGIVHADSFFSKHIMVKELTESIQKNNPNLKLLSMRLDAPPENLTTIAEYTQNELIGFTWDTPVKKQIYAATIFLMKARSLVELGHDVCIILDDILTLAKLCNRSNLSADMKITDDLSVQAIELSKRFLSSARTIENGGSLTVISVALDPYPTQSTTLLLDELKSLTNWTLILDPALTQRRIFPPINIHQSSSLDYNGFVEDLAWVLFNHLNKMTAVEAMDFLKDRMWKTHSNEDLLISLNGE